MAWKDKPTTPSEFRDLAGEVYDDMHLGQEEEAVRQAAAGGEQIRTTVRATSRKKTEEIIIESGATPENAKAIVGVAVKDQTPPPSSLLFALMARTLEERKDLTSKAMRSHEMNRWIDDANGQDKISMLDYSELLEQAKTVGDIYTCFLYALKASKRVFKSELGLAAGLYAMSVDFERDLELVKTGKAHVGVSNVFKLLDKVISDEATPKEIDLFVTSLIARVEEVNMMKPGDLHKASRNGADAKVWSRTADGEPLLIAGYMTMNGTAEKAEQTAESLTRHYREYLELLKQRPGAKLQVISAGSTPIQEIGRMRGEDVSLLVTQADDLAVMRHASMLFSVMDPMLMQDLKKGSTLLTAWHFGAEEINFEGKMAREIKGSIDRLMKAGYPADDERGRKVMKHVLFTLNAWASNNPETFPYFGNQKVIDWVDECPIFMDNVEKALTATSALLQVPKENAILRAEMKRTNRDSALTRQHETKTPKGHPDVVADLEKIAKKAGILDKYPQGSTSGTELRNLIKVGADYAVRRCADKVNPANPRTEWKAWQAEHQLVQDVPTETKVKNGRKHR
ncbi:hypothetical protein [Paraburkholderia sp. BL21I4N1]|uniref:hypothetical protein n=1 Tax=Paraburkholderia sp. BL21I4N1 TaxID=1938801 RepID=UPI000CFBC165|nr:hypothetical protein [Paraburkholderia sp. BL21I4N1]PQV53476.1 hypothetical protein B0G83_102562 [Paraburkholderia sp. BL21I4N1]